YLGLRYLGQGFAPVPHRGHEYYEIVNSARQDDPYEYPQIPGQDAELRRQHGADERPRPGNGGEMVPEQNPLVRRVVILPVVHRISGRLSRIVECRDLGRYEAVIVTVKNNH